LSSILVHNKNVFNTLRFILIIQSIQQWKNREIWRECGTINITSALCYGCVLFSTLVQFYVICSVFIMDKILIVNSILFLFVDCGNLPSVSHGHANSTSATYPTTVGYTCDPGYTLTGSSTVQCQTSGQWSSGRPTCSPVGMSDMHK